MTKDELVDRIMWRFGYDKLPTEQQTATRKVYRKMPMSQLNSLLTVAPSPKS